MNLTEQIKRDEGLRLTPYKDSVGKLTVGYGRNLDDVGISQDEADYMLANDIAKVRVELTRALPWITEMNEARQAVLLNMAFNLGVNGLLQFDRTLELIEKKDYALASAEMLHSKWALQVGKRATRLSEQLRTGEWK